MALKYEETGVIGSEVSEALSDALGTVLGLTGAGVLGGIVNVLTMGAPDDFDKLAQAIVDGSKGGSNSYNISDESKEKWGKGTFDSTEDSLKYHFKEHGEEVGAKDIDQYVRKAEGFSQNLKGANKSYPDNGTPGATRYTKNGKYIIIGPDGKILSYGLAR